MRFDQHPTNRRERFRFANAAERVGLGFLDQSNHAQGLLAIVIDPNTTNPRKHR